MLVFMACHLRLSDCSDLAGLSIGQISNSYRMELEFRKIHAILFTNSQHNISDTGFT